MATYFSLKKSVLPDENILVGLRYGEDMHY